MALSPYFAGQLLKFARACVNKQRERSSTPYPPASRPGQYPRRRTGNLRRSTVVRMPDSSRATVAKIQATGQVAVGVLERAWYGVILEYDMDRLGWARTVSDVIQTRVKGGRLPKGVTWTRSRATFAG